jgi:hypothetical protein
MGAQQQQKTLYTKMDLLAGTNLTSDGKYGLFWCYIVIAFLPGIGLVPIFINQIFGRRRRSTLPPTKPTNVVDFKVHKQKKDSRVGNIGKPENEGFSLSNSDEIRQESESNSVPKKVRISQDKSDLRRDEISAYVGEAVMQTLEEKKSLEESLARLTEPKE